MNQFRALVRNLRSCQTSWQGAGDDPLSLLAGQTNVPATQGGRGETNQRGAVLVMVLVCLLVVATIGSLLARQMIGEQRQLRRREEQIQAFWIAESAVQRGRAQWAASDDYTGETWSLDGKALGRKRSAEVKIQVPAAAEPAAESMHIDVRLQVGASQFRQRREVPIRPAMPVE